jgi:hypothetical protein
MEQGKTYLAILNALRLVPMDDAWLTEVAPVEKQPFASGTIPAELVSFLF